MTVVATGPSLAIGFCAGRGDICRGRFDDELRVSLCDFVTAACLCGRSFVERSKAIQCKVCPPKFTVGAKGANKRSEDGRPQYIDSGDNHQSKIVARYNQSGDVNDAKSVCPDPRGVAVRDARPRSGREAAPS
jgi:hypothetical protein